MYEGCPSNGGPNIRRISALRKELLLYARLHSHPVLKILYTDAVTAALPTNPGTQLPGLPTCTKDEQVSRTPPGVPHGTGTAES